jgi:predicted aspartyl protease
MQTDRAAMFLKQTCGKLETKNLDWPISVLLDTGAYNTVIHKALVANCGILLKQMMPIAIGGYKGDANLCVLHKLNIGGTEMEQVIALAVPFEDELKDHILLGANVINNLEITLLS